MLKLNETADKAILTSARSTGSKNISLVSFAAIKSNNRLIEDSRGFN